MVKHSKSLSSSYISVILFSLTFLLGFILASSSVSADNDTVVDEINIEVPVSCNLTGVGMNTHNATINNGTYATDIGTTTLKASCNDTNGFAIYAAGYTGDEVGGTNSTKLVGANNIGNIVTGTETSGNTSKWAMKLTTNSEATYPISILSDTNGSFSNYHIVPEEFAKVAQRQSSTDIGTAAIGSTLTSTYQVYISPTQSAGTYTGKVIYVLVHPYTHNAPVACNSDATTISEVKCMQDFGNVSSTNRTAILNSMTVGTQYTMKDKRDGKTYTIAKLADGNVWMTQNLDLDLDSNTTYTNEDTDIGYNPQTGEYDTAAWRPNSSTLTNSNASNWVGSYTATPQSYDPGNLYWNTTASDYNYWSAYFGSCTWNNTLMKYENCNESLNPLSTYTSSTGTAQYHLGNYYNWTAAVAMNDSSTHTTDGELIEQSICPAGWTLPRAGDGDDTFEALWEEYGWDENNYYQFSDVTDLTGSPLYFPASGIYYGVLDAVGYDGYFWSPVVNGSDGAYGAYFYVDGSASPLNPSDRESGRSIRCVARPVSSSVSIGGGGGEITLLLPSFLPPAA